MSSSSISYWQKRELDKKHEIIVVGCGIVGLTTAYFLKKKNPLSKITILERAEICGGASIRNAGFACFGSPSELLDDIATIGEKETLDTLQLRWSGLKLLLSIVNPATIDYQPNGGYEIFGHNNTQQDEIVESLPYINGLVAEILQDDHVYQLQHSSMGLKVADQWIYNKLEGQLDPFKMINALRDAVLMQGVTIINGIEVDRIDYNNKVLFLSNNMNIQAQTIALCTNAYIKELMPTVACQAVRNQVFVTDRIPHLELKGCFHLDQGYVYLRNIEDRILIGGARNKFGATEETSQFGNTNDVKTYLKELLIKICPITADYKFEFEWSGILGVGNSKQPIIEQVYPDVYIGVRLGGMGVAIGTMVGNRLAEKIIQDNQA